MNKLLKSIFLALGLAGLMTGLAYAKEESKPTSAKDDSKQMSKPSAGASSDKAGTSGASGAGSMASSKTAQVDINAASEKDLAALPKIGDAKAKAIVKNRPYRGKDELMDKKILTKSEYDAIKDQIVAKQNAAPSSQSSGKSSTMSSDQSSAKPADKPSDMTPEKKK